MRRHKASYYIINFAIATIISVALAALSAFASVSCEKIIAENIIPESATKYYIDNDVNDAQNDSYDLVDQPFSTPILLAHSNCVPAAQSLTKLSKIVSTSLSIITYKEKQTHNVITDFHRTEILSLSHRPSAYYIFALNRMRD